MMIIASNLKRISAICSSVILLVLFWGCSSSTARQSSPAESENPALAQTDDVKNPVTPDRSEESNIDRAMNSLTNQIVNSMVESGGRKIAVIEFSNLNGEVTELGKFLSEELITRLFKTKRFEVVERQLLNKILDEQKLSLTGMIDIESAQILGKVLGVDAIVTGSITDLVDNLKINARLISTKTGSVFAVAATNLFKDESVKKLSEIHGKSASSRQTVQPDQQDKSDVSVFFDDFEREVLGPWEAFSGEWLIVDGTIAQNSYLKPAFVTAGDTNWKDYTLEVKVKGIDGLGPLIAFRIQESTGDCIVWNLGGLKAKITLIQKFNVKTGKYSNLPLKKNSPYGLGKWHDVKVIVKGGNAKCYLDGILLIDLTDPEIGKLSRGKIGLGTWRSRIYFDNVRVTENE